MLSRCRIINQKIIAASCNSAAPAFFSLRRPQAPAVRLQTSRQNSGKRFNVPISAEFVARVSGIPTMGRLPFQETADGLDAAFVGVPIDTGTSNRPGARCWTSSTLVLLSESYSSDMNTPFQLLPLLSTFYSLNLDTYINWLLITVVVVFS